MIDVLGAFFVTTIYAAIVGVLIGLAPIPTGTRLVAFVVAALWGAALAIISALGGLSQGATGPIPPTILLLATSLGLLFGAWSLSPRFRSALLGVPLAALIGLNAMRLIGLFFDFMTAAGRMSGPFAPIAGTGDIVVAVLAIPLAVLAARGAAEQSPWLRLWNAFGALDLVTAIVLGILSAPGTPIRVFTEGPGTQVLTTLPWTFLPGAIVPLFLLIHLTIAARLRLSRQVSRPVALGYT